MQAEPIPFAHQKLELRPNQVDHAKKILAILQLFHFYIDGSEMGAGKTYILIWIAIQLGIPVVVFCPKSGMLMWEGLLYLYNCPRYNLEGVGSVITYDSLRSTKGHQPKHGLLTRYDDANGIRFEPTALLHAMIRAGTLFVFDEAQKGKNKGSGQSKAMRAIIQPLYNIPNSSRAAFLSGSLVDKIEHCETFLRIFGLITQKRLYTKIRGQVEPRLEGVDELHKWAMKIDMPKFQQFTATHQFVPNNKGSRQYIFNLFIEVLKPKVMSIVPSLQFDKIVRNGYYPLLPEEIEKYKRGVNNLAQNVQYDAVRETTYVSREGLGAITQALRDIQLAKVGAMIRQAKKILTTPMVNAAGQPMYPKVVLYADYYEVIDILLRELAEYNPGELTGRININKRDEYISAFNEPSNRCRLLIGNPLVGGVVISLHDTHGLFPRVAYIMAGYKVNELHQTTGRFGRTGMQSQAVIEFFYGNCGTLESNILHTMADKGKNIESMHSEQATIFPNQYPHVFYT